MFFFITGWTIFLRAFSTVRQVYWDKYIKNYVNVMLKWPSNNCTESL